MLSVEAIEDSFTQWWGDRYQPAEYLERVRGIADFRRVVIEDAGHMLHHDQPERVARLLEEFVQLDPKRGDSFAMQCISAF